MTTLRFSNDPADIDIEVVHRWLSEQSYWAAGRSREAHERAMAASRNYAVLADEAAPGDPAKGERVASDPAPGDPAAGERVAGDSAPGDPAPGDPATGERIVGYARVITDEVTFAWLADVFVDPGSRGLGVGKLLVAGIVAELEPLGLKRIALRTSDAHGLYAQFGFAPLGGTPDEGMWMQRTPAPA
ncbi:GNAT family N-acetyltransferase [Frondihabitans australicus]|uniref:Acetyltransferase (GNAT) family protein n=1 Tax=Frondihabitans australicus TaxID=386892 RepID=A0A495IC54_9MICO|nr:GNAT family N-acetyltransferase [Frondihabitans australicus]RKR73499.1 acetyltransferase (GNAT) family protein [Frondihabitans australicus]